MKQAAIILALLCVASLMVVGYLYFTCDITVSFERAADARGVNGVSAAEDPALFERIREAVSAGGTELDAPENYVFYTWKVTVRNNTYVDLETLELSVVNGRTQGVIAYTQEDPDMLLPAHRSTDVTMTVLAEPFASPELPVRVTWYLWGRVGEQEVVLR